MVDEEVENVLRELRERVRAEQGAHASLTTGERHPPDDSHLASYAPEIATPAADALARIEAHLTTTGRAWDRLPPVVSHRTGWLARLELWLKRRFKSVTRWYVWEQINFNASVHHALADTLEALAAGEREFAKLRAEMQAGFKTQQSTFETWSAGFIETQRAEFERWRADDKRWRADVERWRADIEMQRNQLIVRLSSVEELSAARDAQLSDTQANIVTQLRDEIAAHADALRREQEIHADALRREREERMMNLQNELRERDEHLRDEARVTFRQLSLEAGEAAVMQDRARRLMEARLAKLENSDK